jgi:ribosome-binding factor A
LQSRKKSEQLLESIKQIEEKLSNLLGQKMRMEEQVQVASKESDEIQTHLQKMTALFSSLKKEEERCAVQFIIHDEARHTYSLMQLLFSRAV